MPLIPDEDQTYFALAHPTRTFGFDHPLGPPCGLRRNDDHFGQALASGRLLDGVQHVLLGFVVVDLDVDQSVLDASRTEQRGFDGADTGILRPKNDADAAGRRRVVRAVVGGNPKRGEKVRFLAVGERRDSIAPARPGSWLSYRAANVLRIERLRGRLQSLVALQPTLQIVLGRGHQFQQASRSQGEGARDRAPGDSESFHFLEEIFEFVGIGTPRKGRRPALHRPSRDLRCRHSFCGHAGIALAEFAYGEDVRQQFVSSLDMADGRVERLVELVADIGRAQSAFHQRGADRPGKLPGLLRLIVDQRKQLLAEDLDQHGIVVGEREDAPHVFALVELETHGSQGSADQEFGVVDVTVEQRPDLEGVVRYLHQRRIFDPDHARNVVKSGQHELEPVFRVSHQLQERLDTDEVRIGLFAHESVRLVDQQEEASSVVRVEPSANRGRELVSRSGGGLEYAGSDRSRELLEGVGSVVHEIEVDEGEDGVRGLRCMDLLEKGRLAETPTPEHDVGSERIDDRASFPGTSLEHFRGHRRFAVILVWIGTRVGLGDVNDGTAAVAGIRDREG